MTSFLKRELKITKEENNSSDMANLIFELRNSSTKLHLNHLLITGIGSNAAHLAMKDFYTDIIDLLDDVAEEYQGATEKLLVFPTNASFPTMTNAQECLVYLRDLYNKVQAAQTNCHYSEINNKLDEIKSLISSTKYKLLFLK